jgi:hypothetical protein
MQYPGRGYDAEHGFRGGWGPERFIRYDREFRGGERGWGPGGYDAGYRGYGYGSERQGDYRSRWEMENGDPFGDRTAHTPIRMMRGDYLSRYDQGFERGRNYHAANPMGYEPYRSGWGRRNEQIRRERYDSRWF